MKPDSETFTTAAAFRLAFDESFADVQTQDHQVQESLLLVRIGGDPYAIRLREITELVTTRAVVPLPSSDHNLLGLAGIRGNIVPVFGLGPLLGYIISPDASRWAVLYGTDEPIALAFSEFEGYLQLPATAIHRDSRIAESERDTPEIAHVETGPRPIIDIHRVVGLIRNRSNHERPPEE
jgi:chemotaxis signal transduction protein